MHIGIGLDTENALRVLPGAKEVRILANESKASTPGFSTSFAGLTILLSTLDDGVSGSN